MNDDKEDNAIKPTRKWKRNDNIFFKWKLYIVNFWTSVNVFYERAISSANSLMNPYVFDESAFLLLFK